MSASTVARRLIPFKTWDDAHDPEAWMVHDGTIPSYEVNGMVLVDPAHVEAWYDAGRYIAAGGEAVHIHVLAEGALVVMSELDAYSISFTVEMAREVAAALLEIADEYEAANR